VVVSLRYWEPACGFLFRVLVLQRRLETYIIRVFPVVGTLCLTADHVPAKHSCWLFPQCYCVLTAEMSVLFATVVLLAACTAIVGRLQSEEVISKLHRVAVPTVTIPYLSSILYVGGLLTWFVALADLYAHRARSGMPIRFGSDESGNRLGSSFHWFAFPVCTSSCAVGDRSILPSFISLTTST